MGRCRYSSRNVFAGTVRAMRKVGTAVASRVTVASVSTTAADGRGVVDADAVEYAAHIAESTGTQDESYDQACH